MTTTPPADTRCPDCQRTVPGRIRALLHGPDYTPADLREWGLIKACHDDGCEAVMRDGETYLTDEHRASVGKLAYCKPFGAKSTMRILVRITGVIPGRNWTSSEGIPIYLVTSLFGNDSESEPVSRTDLLEILPDDTDIFGAFLHGWTPTTDNINRLPGPVRDYVCNLVTLCDPAGIVQENEALRRQNAELLRMIEVINDESKARLHAGTNIARAALAACDRMQQTIGEMTHAVITRVKFEEDAGHIGNRDLTALKQCLTSAVLLNLPHDEAVRRTVAITDALYTPGQRR